MKKNEKYMTKYLKERYNEERTTLTLVNSNSLLTETTLAKWLLEFLGIPGNKGVNFHGKFGLGIPRHSAILSISLGLQNFENTKL